MDFDRCEIADPAGGVHQPHQAVPHLRREARAVLILPFFEWPSIGDLKAFEERSLNAHLPITEMQRVHIDPAWRETHARSLNDDRVTGDLGLDDGQTLSERMICELGCNIRPQQIRQVVTRELLA
jgi:hypothetical protein